MRPIIFQVHFHGIYYAGDHIDIHDYTSVNFYQGENTKETNTTRRMGYTRIETERAGRRGKPPTPQAPTLQAGTNKITAYDAGLTNEEKGEIKTIFFFPKIKFSRSEKNRMRSVYHLHRRTCYTKKEPPRRISEVLKDGGYLLSHFTQYHRRC